MRSYNNFAVKTERITTNNQIFNKLSGFKRVNIETTPGTAYDSFSYSYADDKNVDEAATEMS